MTWKTLGDWISRMSDEQRGMDVTVIGNIFGHRDYELNVIDRSIIDNTRHGDAKRPHIIVGE